MIIRTQIHTQMKELEMTNMAESVDFTWWARRDLNPRPIRYERTALTS